MGYFLLPPAFLISEKPDWIEVSYDIWHVASRQNGHLAIFKEDRYQSFKMLTVDTFPKDSIADWIE
jgi:hypothetical protein